MELIDYKPEHAIGLLDDAVEEGLQKTRFSVDQARTLATSGPSMTCVVDGKVIACGGIIIGWEGHGEAWFIARRNIGEIHIDPKIARDQLWAWIREYKLVRCQAPLIAGWEVGVKYAQWLGFEHEAILKKYHLGGIDADMHAIIIGD